MADRDPGLGNGHNLLPGEGRGEVGGLWLRHNGMIPPPPPQHFVVFQ